MNWLRRIFGGKTRMAALNPGTSAPDFSLSTLDGKRFSLRDALASGPVLLAFFKVSCPTCQYALPFLERLFRAYRNRGVTLLGVSQNVSPDTAAFAEAYGITFPILLDDTKTFPVSNAYGLSNVPTLFWITADGEIEITSVGWNRADFERINREMADAGKTLLIPPFRSGEEVRDFRAG
jgi:peroxiredoxin